MKKLANVRSWLAVVGVMLLASLAACDDRGAPPITPAPAAPGGRVADASRTPEASVPATPSTGKTVAGAKPGVNTGGATGAATRTLRALMYSDYIDEALLEEFEAKSGIAVSITPFEEATAAVAKLQHGAGDSQFDLVVISHQEVPLLVRQGLIRPLDRARLPNLKNLDPQFTRVPGDAGNRYSVAYQWGTTGLIYDKSKVGASAPSWAWLFDPAKQPGRFLLVSEMRDQVGTALLHLGHDVNSTDPEQVKRAGQLLAQAKRSPKCEGIGDAVENVKKVISGAADVAVVWNGDALRLIAEEKAQGRVAFAVPEAGAVAWVDVMGVPAKAPDAEAAHRFMDFLLEPKVGARLSNFTRFASPNQAAKPHIAPEDLANPAMYPPDAVRAKLAFLAEVGQAAGLYDEVWTAVSAAQ